MDEKRLPIICFKEREKDDTRVEGGGNKDDPGWVLQGSELKARSLELSNELATVLALSLEKKANDVPFVFVATIDKDSRAKSRRADISSLFSIDGKEGVIGLIGERDLLVASSNESDFEIFRENFADCISHRYGISCLEKISPFSMALSEDKSAKSYKVKLIDFIDEQTNKKVARSFEKFLNERVKDYKKCDYLGSNGIYKIPAQHIGVLDDLIGGCGFSSAVYSIEPMPTASACLDSFGEAAQDIDIVPVKGKNYKTLGILDSGIASVKPLDPWIVGKRYTPYPEDYLNLRHGTFVAGLALFADRLNNVSWVGHDGIKIFDAAVVPDTSKEDLPEDELVANIEEAIKANHDEIKIWNLSVSINKEISLSAFSDFGIALDRIQDKYGVLICKSIGNTESVLKGKSRESLLIGSDSIRSLAVGSAAQSKEGYDIAFPGDPSPFSRRGPGPQYVIKPEVVHYGGNAGADKDGKIKIHGVKSLSPDGCLVGMCGTSFSTPIVSSLITGLYDKIDGDFDPLLLKALVVHSARYGDEVSVAEKERTKVLGFGVPSTVDSILYNNPHEATLVLRGNLRKGKSIDINDFPMPKSLCKNGYYTGQIIVTLIYNPLLESSQGAEYCQSDLDINFGTYDEKFSRDTSKKNILNPIGRRGTKNVLLPTCYSKKLVGSDNGEFAKREKLLIRYGDKYYPVKKYGVDLANMSETNKDKYLKDGRLWFLSMKCLYRNFSLNKSTLNGEVLSSEYCLIVTIRDKEKKERVYDEVNQLLTSQFFEHNQIKLANDVRINVVQ